jgi:hypothetical protein
VITQPIFYRADPFLVDSSCAVSSVDRRLVAINNHLAIKRWNPLFAGLREAQQSYLERLKLMSCVHAAVGEHVAARIVMNSTAHCTTAKIDAHF